MARSNPTRVLRELPRAESERVAFRIARKILRTLRTLRRGVLEDVARHFRVTVRWNGTGSDASLYVPPLAEGDFAEIVLSASLSEGQRWRAFVHELAHHLMHTWVAPTVYSCERVCLADVWKSS